MHNLIIHLKERKVIRASGTEAFEFFQGLMTQDIYLLKDEPAIYGVFLTPQGKFLFDAFFIKDGEDILLDCNDGEGLLKHLKNYKLRRKVDFSLTELNVYVCRDIHKTSHELITFSDPRKPNFSTRVIAKDMISAMEDEQPYHFQRIQYGIPEAPFDLIYCKTFPLEARLDELNAVSYKKGCYIGQELVSRTHYTGVIRKKLLPVRFKREGIKTDDIIYQNGHAIGEVRSHATYMGETLAICMLRTEELDTKKAINARDIEGLLVP